MIDLSKLPPIPKESKFKQALGLGIGIWDYFDEKEKELGDTYTLTFPGQGPMIWTSDTSRRVTTQPLPPRFARETQTGTEPRCSTPWFATLRPCSR